MGCRPEEKTQAIPVGPRTNRCDRDPRWIGWRLPPVLLGDARGVSSDGGKYVRAARRFSRYNPRKTIFHLEQPVVQARVHGTGKTLVAHFEIKRVGWDTPVL